MRLLCHTNDDDIMKKWGRDVDSDWAVRWVSRFQETNRHCIQTAGRVELIFFTEASFDLSYSGCKEIRVPPKKGTSFLTLFKL